MTTYYITSDEQVFSRLSDALSASPGVSLPLWAPTEPAPKKKPQKSQSGTCRIIRTYKPDPETERMYLLRLTARKAAEQDKLVRRQNYDRKRTGTLV